ASSVTFSAGSANLFSPSGKSTNVLSSSVHIRQPLPACAAWLRAIQRLLLCSRTRLDLRPAPHLHSRLPARDTSFARRPRKPAAAREARRSPPSGQSSPPKRRLQHAVKPAHGWASMAADEDVARRSRQNV